MNRNEKIAEIEMEYEELCSEDKVKVQQFIVELKAKRNS